MFLRFISKTLFYIILATFAYRNAYSSQTQCSSLFENTLSYTGNIKKIRNNGTIIYQVRDGYGDLFFYKETEVKPNHFNLTFNSEQFAPLAYNLLKANGLEKYVAYSSYHPAGIRLIIDGKEVLTKPGILQKGETGLQTANEHYKLQHNQTSSGIEDLFKTLNSKPWKTEYSNWKAIWILLLQTDLNIENFALKNSKVFVFDLGDAFNSWSNRNQYGIHSIEDAFDINFPNNPQDRKRFYPDFRLADENIKKLIVSVSEATPEQIVAQMDPDHIHSQIRGTAITEIAYYIKLSAVYLRSRLDKSPF